MALALRYVSALIAKAPVVTVRTTSACSLGNLGSVGQWLELQNTVRNRTFTSTRASRARSPNTPSPAEKDETDETPEQVKPKTIFHPAGAAGPVDVSSLERLEKSVNQVILLGRVGSDPQLRGTEENPVLLFSMATHENFRDESGSIQQKTMWHRIAIFKAGLRESTFRICKKGQRLYVTGHISYGNVKDPESGHVRTISTIIADNVIVLAPPAGGQPPS